MNMTNKEAAEILKKMKHLLPPKAAITANLENEALDIAIKCLSVGYIPSPFDQVVEEKHMEK